MHDWRSFALTLHPEMTCLIEFGRRAAERRERRGLGKPETFGFLGFTLICGKSRRGKFLLWRKSRRDRLQAKLLAVKEEMRRRMDQPVPQQGKWLRGVVGGWFNYHAVPTNIRALQTFRDCVVRLWLRSLRRRGQRDKTTSERMKRLADDFLPKPRILHPWPEQRFAVKHPRWEPYAGMPHVRSCAGARSNARPYRDSRIAVPRVTRLVQASRHTQSPSRRLRAAPARSVGKTPGLSHGSSPRAGLDRGCVWPPGVVRPGRRNGPFQPNRETRSVRWVRDLARQGADISTRVKERGSMYRVEDSRTRVSEILCVRRVSISSTIG